jgi:hypothetical protein
VCPIQQPPNEAIRLCGTNEECDSFNEKVHIALQQNQCGEGADCIGYGRVQGRDFDLQYGFEDVHVNFKQFILH